MKYFVAIVFVCFMGGAVYVLLHEKNMMNPHAKVHGLKPLKAKKIGERIREDIPAYELQRQVIDSNTIYKFESKNKNENYEMDEDELEAFSRGLNGLRDARDAGRITAPSIFDVNQNKEYYEVGE